MTDFKDLLQTASLFQQKDIVSTAYVGGGYLPSSLTANFAINGGSTLGLTLSFNSTRASEPPIDPTQAVRLSGTSSSQPDVLLGMTASVNLMGGDIVIGTGIATTSGKKNQPDPSW